MMGPAIAFLTQMDGWLDNALTSASGLLQRGGWFELFLAVILAAYLYSSERFGKKNSQQTGHSNLPGSDSYLQWIDGSDETGEKGSMTAVGKSKLDLLNLKSDGELIGLKRDVENLEQAFNESLLLLAVNIPSRATLRRTRRKKGRSNRSRSCTSSPNRRSASATIEKNHDHKKDQEQNQHQRKERASSVCQDLPPFHPNNDKLNGEDISKRQAERNADNIGAKQEPLNDETEEYAHRGSEQDLTDIKTGCKSHKQRFRKRIKTVVHRIEKLGRLKEKNLRLKHHLKLVQTQLMRENSRVEMLRSLILGLRTRSFYAKLLVYAFFVSCVRSFFFGAVKNKLQHVHTVKR
mmetsp:Transcript_28526/g.69556  ORF Transcript_28526/g.69556 Transcript_28526/m.69556 type:complete len:349 (-) Transcript_28526:65-1111(-)